MTRATRGRAHTAGRSAVRALAWGSAALAVALLVASLTACTRPLPPRAYPLDPPRTPVERRIERGLESWLGTPYCYGGTDRRCADCSGFVGALYAELFDLELPRRAVQIATRGRKVSARELRAGDLLFFRTAPHEHHVGIYLRAGKFVHASCHAGVTLSSLEERYWRRRIWTARRVL